MGTALPEYPGIWRVRVMGIKSSIVLSRVPGDQFGDSRSRTFSLRILFVL